MTKGICTSVSLSWVSVKSLLLIYSNTNYALSPRFFLTTSCLCVAETRQNSYIVKLVPECIISSLPKGLHDVIDGAGLLHKFSRPKHSTYTLICAIYTQHITRGYDMALVVFDGYHGPSTEDEAHRKRTGNDVGASVSVSSEMRLTMSKKTFLSIEKNKQALINLLSQEIVDDQHRLQACYLSRCRKKQLRSSS